MATPAVRDPWCRFGFWGLGSYPPGYRQAEVRLTDHDLVWIIEGAPTYWIDGTAVRAAAPCVLLLRPGQRMRIAWDAHAVTRNGYIHFTPQVPSPHVPSDDRWPTCTTLPADDAVRPLLRHLLWLLGSHPAGWQPLAASALAHAIGMLSAGSLRGIALNASRVGPLAEAVIDLLVPRWSRPAKGLTMPSLAEMAAATGMSREGFCRSFRTEVGLPPQRALHRLRLERSAHLLCDGRASVAAVASACGFDDPFNFSRVFRTAYGCAPRDFAEAFRSGRAVLLLPAPESFTTLRSGIATRLRWYA